MIAEQEQGISPEDITVASLVKEYFLARPNQDISHGPVVDWVEEKYVAVHGTKPRDTWRAIRKHHEDGLLVKVKKGVYKYDPEVAEQGESADFTGEQKKEIFERDEYKCVICGLGEKEGVEIHADHIKPKSLGGLSIVSNGQTLCARHNFIKKQARQTETGKKMFVRLYEAAKADDNGEILDFCGQILSIYEKFNMNGHIVWNK